MAFALRVLSKLLGRRAGGLLVGVGITADEVHECIIRLLAAWPRKYLSVAKDRFKFCLPSTCIHIEQSFGTMVGSRGIL